jgi:hypothetical protein
MIKMSLTVYLEEEGTCIYESDITHNLGSMAEACGIYYACWRPNEINCSKAKHIIPMLESGVKLLKKHREFYEQFNSSNGWGMYENFLPWVERYLAACKEHPEARINVWR